ncbi:CotH kinase family protein [Neolewinella aurantiaca]|uniref:CotH kinase family protein n=1 Tax=Neolewinella aurantiaca TaxID=2602767 RepID=UPI0029E7CB3A|nr:CotH kinase family protein [Neolewinella aurantiaca]
MPGRSTLRARAVPTLSEWEPGLEGDAVSRSARSQRLLRPGAGFYARSVTVTLPDRVRYTLDGSTPTKASLLSEGEITIRKTTVLRYAAFNADGKRTSPVAGATYFIGEPRSRLLTLSIGIDPWRLFDPANGWFKPGYGADPGHWKQPGANWWTSREHPAHLDLIEPEGANNERSVFSGTTGFRMFGGMSRLHPQKSFSISARKKYGEKRIRHQLFGKNGADSFKFLVARNAGSDWNRSYIRDVLLTGLLQDESWDLERQAGRPVQVYINGEYWGIYHLREKINARFLSDRHPEVDKDKLDLIEHEHTVKQGSIGEYQKLRSFVESKDLSNPENYRRLGRMMDIDNYQRLQIAQTYFDNRDAGGNIRYWKPKTAGSRWRWILYDVDQGFGLHQEEGYLRNTLEFYTEANGPAWPNPPWSTLFQRKLLANTEYRRYFVNRTLDYLHTDFAPVTVAAAIERRVAALEHDMPRQLKRWKGKEKNWRIHLDRIRAFGENRPAHLREHLREYFGAGGDRMVTIVATPGGYIEVNKNIRVDEERYKGTYFQNFPLHLRTVAHNGFRLSEANSQVVKRSAGPEGYALDLNAERSYHFEAAFEPYDHPLIDQVIFNEVCPRSKASGDWVELYNRTEETVDLTGWRLTDHHHETRLPSARIDPGDYLVVCRDIARFRETYPFAHNVIEGLPFGIDKKREKLALYSSQGAYVNAIAFEVEEPDTAYVQALVLPGLDNTDVRHWALQSGEGTPCAANPEYLETAVISRQGYWLRIGVGVGVLLLVGLVRGMRGE